MAKIKFGAVVSDARGSIGGTTFSRGKSGPIAKTAAGPRLRLTSFNTTVRALQKTLVSRWLGNLTQVQRDAWKALALANPRTDVFGNSYTRTGQQLYIGVNRIRASAGLALIDDAPADQSVTALITATIVATAPSTLTLTFTNSPLPAGTRLYLWATPSLSPGKIATKRDMKLIGVSATAQTSPYAAGTQYTNRLGSMVSGRLITVYAQTERDDRGAVSPGILASDLA